MGWGRHALVGLGDAEQALGFGARARRHFERVLDNREVEGKSAALVGDARFGLARVELDAGRRDAAVAQAREALALHEGAPRADPASSAHLRAWLDEHDRSP